jgi:hypothetical protein
MRVASPLIAKAERIRLEVGDIRRSFGSRGLPIALFDHANIAVPNA